jgi:hypothetical protein
MSISIAVTKKQELFTVCIVSYPNLFQCGSSFLTSMRIQVQGAKLIRIHADPDPDPGQTLR